MKRELKVKKVNVDTLTPHPKNVRIHNEKQIQELAKSVEMFGVIRPVVTDENGMILTGHGLVDAIKYLGRTEVETHIISGLSDTDKKKLMLADNRIYTLGYDDFDAIDEILKDIGDFDIPGFDPDDLQMLYGDTTITETLEGYVPVGIEEKQEKQSQETVVPQNVVNQRAEVEQLAQEEPFVICHNCGAKVSIE